MSYAQDLTTFVMGKDKKLYYPSAGSTVRYTSLYKLFTRNGSLYIEFAHEITKVVKTSYKRLILVQKLKKNI